jgi:hypothetical protein
MLDILLPNEKFNEMAKSGKIDSVFGRIFEESRPEAVYFTERNGQRNAVVIVDIATESDIPRLAEPWFLSFGATVEFKPAMTPEDLKKANLRDVAKKW